MRKIIIILLVLTIKSFGQTPARQNNSHSYDILYGQDFFTQNKSRQFSTTSNFKFNLPINFIGFGASAGANEFNLKKKKKKFYLAQSGYFQYYIPQTVHIDTVTYKVSGFRINIGYGKALHSKNHKYNLLGYIGINGGRLLLKSKEYGKEQSIFISPKIGIQPKIIIGHFALSIISEYQFDVLNSAWLTSSFKRNDNFKLNSITKSALSLALCIGYHVH